MTSSLTKKRFKYYACVQHYGYVKGSIRFASSALLRAPLWFLIQLFTLIGAVLAYSLVVIALPLQFFENLSKRTEKAIIPIEWKDSLSYAREYREKHNITD